MAPPATVLEMPKTTGPRRSNVTDDSHGPEATRARMLALVRDHWWSNRTAVNPDTDRLVEAIQRRLPCTVREFASGSEVLTWIVPRRWAVREAWLAHEDGTRIVDFADHPLHLWTHSVPFRGTVSRAELESHLYHDAQRLERVPYHFANGYRYTETPCEWGFSLPHLQYLRLTGERYRVHIDADLDYSGTMKVIDCHLPGRSPDILLFAAHTCHPGMVTDGLSNVAVLVELFARLARRTDRRYGYRLVLGPEYFAAAAFLAAAPAEEIERLRGALYLDLVGNGRPFGFAPSYQGDTPIDRVVASVVPHHTAEHREVGHRKLAGNDEMFYNGPGFDIPMVEFGCTAHPDHHTDGDNMNALDEQQMFAALDLLERTVNVFETDFVPVRKFRGPLYLSRYGLYTALQEDARTHDVQEGVQILMDGRRSCFDIAHRLGADFEYVRTFCEALEQQGLIERAAPSHAERKMANGA